MFVKRVVNEKSKAQMRDIVDKPRKDEPGPVLTGTQKSSLFSWDVNDTH